MCDKSPQGMKGTHAAGLLGALRAITGCMIPGQQTSQKLQRVRRLLHTQQLDGVWITHHAHVAWLCDGARVHVHTASDAGVVSLFVTPNDAWAITDDIEHARLVDEEGMHDWEFIRRPWHARPWEPWDRLPRSAAVGCDAPHKGLRDVHSALLQQRTPLMSGEEARFETLGAEASAAVFGAVQKLVPNMTEHAIAASVAAAVYGIGAEPVVLLVAGDDRMERVRHPLPTSQVVQRHGMIVVCARRHGLVVSFTRMFAFGVPHPALQRRLTQVATIDACAIAQTRPLTPLTQIWTCIQEAYAQVGHPEAWQGLHQGGPCSYAPRDLFLGPHSPGMVQAHQAFAWNPSIPGAKSEDTLLCTPTGTKLLTLGPWPTQRVSVGEAHVLRPTLVQL